MTTRGGHVRDRMRLLRLAREARLIGRGGTRVAWRMPVRLVQAARRATGITRVADIILYALLKVLDLQSREGRLAWRRERRRPPPERRFPGGGGR